MFENRFKTTHRTIRKALLGAILAGATMFSAPTTGCDASGVTKGLSGNAARLVIGGDSLRRYGEGSEGDSLLGLGGYF